MAAQEMILKLLFNDEGTFVGLEEINKELKKVDESTEKTSKGFTSAKAELRALQNQMLEMDQSSEEFKKASARAAELKDSIGDLSAEINANAGNAFEGLSNNIGLFGSRLMDLDLKGAGQALSAMGNSVSRIDFKTLKDEVGGLIKGLGNLAGAIVGNPILALGGAVALLVLNFDKINAALNGTADKVKKLGEANAIIEKQNLILDARINKEKTLYGESFKILELEKEKALNNLKVAENELAIAKTTGDINVIREKENKLIETRNLLSGITAKGEADRAKLVEDAKNITIEGYKEEQDRQAAIAKFEDARQQQLAVIAEKQRLIKANLQKEELIGTEQQYTTERANFVEKDIETKKIAVQSERQKELQAELNKLIEEEQILRNAKVAIATNTTVNELKAQELALQKELNQEGKTAEQIQAEYEKSQEELTDILLKWDEERLAMEAELAAYQKAAREERLNDEERIAEEIYQASLSSQQKEISEVRNKYFELIRLADFYKQDSTSLKAAQAQAERDIIKKYADEELKIEDEKNKKKQEMRMANIQSNFEMAELAVGALIDLNQAAAKGDEASQRKAFERNKMLQKAQATIAMASGIVQQLAVPQDQLTGMNFVKAAAVAAAGVANIVKINQTQFNGTVPSPNGGNLNAPTNTTNAPAVDFSGGNFNNNAPGTVETYVLAGNVANALEARQKIIDQSYL